jgi:hypothetical protein
MKPILSKKEKAWRKYQALKKEGREEEARKAWEEYDELNRVIVKIMNKPPLEEMVHDQILGIRNKRNARITPEAIRALERYLSSLAWNILESAGQTAHIQDFTRDLGETQNDITIDEEHIYLGYLDILSYTDEESVEEYNRIREILMEGE